MPRRKAKEIVVQVNPFLELINSILLTSKYNEITKPLVGYGLMTEESNEYTEAIKKFFGKYQNHKIYKFIENMIPNGFTFSRPVEIALSLSGSKDFTLQYPLSSLCIKYSGGISKINELLALLKDFAKQSNYFNFYHENLKFYDSLFTKASKLVKHPPFVTLLENEYGKEQASYNLVLSSLMVGNFGICFANHDTKQSDLFAVLATDNFSLSPEILLHEYSHPFINPLTTKYSDLVKKYQSTHEKLTASKLPDYRSGYGDWEECVNEHLVRAMVIHLLQKCELYEAANQLLQNDLHSGYRYIPLILEKYNFYDNHRYLYKDLESYYPELLEVFACDFAIE
ncbi:MAG TPA: DUF4932 domain-containing protein [Candidatus Gallacutalibacter stercoravium]|nr:DUF4932 domain-containing protein [Candidatus Gallacutalibacter stercoravium]